MAEMKESKLQIIDFCFGTIHKLRWHDFKDLIKDENNFSSAKVVFSERLNHWVTNPGQMLGRQLCYVNDHLTTKSS